QSPHLSQLSEAVGEEVGVRHGLDVDPPVQPAGTGPGAPRCPRAPSRGRQADAGSGYRQSHPEQPVPGHGSIPQAGHAAAAAAGTPARGRLRPPSVPPRPTPAGSRSQPAAAPPAETRTVTAGAQSDAAHHSRETRRTAADL